MGGKIGKALESTWKSTTSIMLVVLISTGDVGKESPNAAIQAFSAAFYIRPARASELRMPRAGNTDLEKLMHMSLTNFRASVVSKAFTATSIPLQNASSNVLREEGPRNS
jgi:hypothetical protein